MKFLSEILAKIFDFWHGTISLALPPSCRFEPTCSVYGAQALRKHGLFKGLWLTLIRLAKCHPWGPHGHDPVP